MLLARLVAAEVARLCVAVWSVLLAVVFGAVTRGGRSWMMLRWVKEGVSGHLRYMVSIDVSKYDPKSSQSFTTGIDS